MGKAYSLDLREGVVAALEGGMSTRQAAARFSISIATAGIGHAGSGIEATYGPPNKASRRVRFSMRMRISFSVNSR